MIKTISRFSFRMLISAGFLLVGTITVFSQDSIRYMHYNLLDFGNPSGFCSETNNNTTLKLEYLRRIVEYAHPDIIAVNEMQNSDVMVQKVLDSALNVNGVNYYHSTPFTNFANSYIINEVYYNAEKLGLHSMDVVLTQPRDINFYEFYPKTTNLAFNHDTLFFTAIVAHLKAGSQSADAQDRALEANQLMQYLDIAYEPGNFLVSGDFNLYSSSEGAFQALTNYSNDLLRFNDPINQPGDWNNNGSFAHIHTQSTHASSNGCASSGGMDDRFDFILASNFLMFGTTGIQALPSTYKALGQDGLHFNNSVNDPPQNNSVPPNVLEALYGMSDHLPVIMDLKLSQTLGIHSPEAIPSLGFSFPNPVNGNLELTITTSTPSDVDLRINNGCGQCVLSKNVGTIYHSGNCIIPVHYVSPGFYLVELTSKGRTVTKKMIIQ